MLVRLWVGGIADNNCVLVCHTVQRGVFCPMYRIPERQWAVGMWYDLGGQGNARTIPVH